MYSDSSYTNTVLFYGILLGLIPAMIAQSKGRSFLGWWIFGAAFFILALPASLLLKPIVKKGSSKKCPYCAEIIKIDAIVCRFCGRNLSIRETTPIIKHTTPIQYYDFDIPKCPNCGVQMNIAVGKHGQNQGKKFYVCPNYKECRQYWPVDQP